MQRYNGQLINKFATVINGNAAAGAQVTVRLKSTGATVTLYATDDIGGATLANPLTADAKGYYGFYAPDGVYTLDVNISGTPQLEIQLQDIAALQAQFDAALANAGYIPVGTFAAGCTVSQSNGVVSDGTNFWRWDGALPKTVTAGSDPTPTGVGNWVLVSDGAFRDALADNGSTELIAGFQARQLRLINGIKNLIPAAGVCMDVAGFYVGTNIGGGQFYYDPGLNKSNHNGGTIIAPEAIASWDGSHSNIATLTNWTGTGNGCYVRVDDGNKDAVIFGLRYDLTYSSHIPLQKAVNVLRDAKTSSGVFRLDAPVYLPSDSALTGAGCSYGGSVIYTYGSSSAFLFGATDNPRHTRVKLKGFKILSHSATDREKYLVDAFRQEDAPTEGEAFMDEISEISFGDVDTGVVGHQMNGLRIFGTANNIENIRTLRCEVDPSKPNTTGIGVLDSGANRFINIQCETGSRFILRDSVSKITNIHMERSALEYQNSSYTLVDGANIADGSVILDENSNCNRIANMSGANIMLNNLGLFNDLDNVQATGLEHGVFTSGLLKKESWLKPTVIASAWDSANHRVFRLPSSGQYFVAVLLKNRKGTQPSSGVAEVFNLTSSVQIIQKTFSLNRYGETQPARNNSAQTLSFFTVFSGNANDDIVVRKVSGDYAVVSVFISKGENVNPLGIDGSGWDVSGAPAPSESVYVGLQNCTPYMSGGKVAVNVTSGQNFSVSQFFASKTNAKLYCAIVKGAWTGKLRLRQNGGAHDGSLSESTYAESGPSMADGKNCAILYFTREDIAAFPNRSSISFGNFANVVTSSSVVIDFCIVFPVE